MLFVYSKSMIVFTYMGYDKQTMLRMLQLQYIYYHIFGIFVCSAVMQRALLFCD